MGLSGATERPARGSGPRICLHLIVKNEAAILERCLAAALPLTDAWVICDTGSEDGTPELIEAFFAAHGILGELHHIAFRSFGQARNEALALARAAGLAFDYLLLCDADMELVTEDPGLRGRLKAPAYSLRQRNGLAYDNIRLLRRETAARYVGATHEYLAVEGRVERLEGAWFRDHACGSNRPGKLERDRRLLEAELEEHPDAPRSTFYLAQTLRDLGEHSRARELYQRRAGLGGFEEEAWYSVYQAGLCCLAEGDDTGFLQHMLRAYSRRPGRAEPLYRLARRARELGNSELALLFCEAAERIGLPTGDRLFVEEWVYRWGLREEVSICGYHSSLQERQAAGSRACSSLALDPGVPAPTRDTARRNLAWYAQPLTERIPATRLTPLELELPEPFTATNPSLVRHQGRILVLLRGVNYRIHEGRYRLPPGDDEIRTQNWLATLGADRELTEARPVEDHTAGERLSYPVRGFEDGRLISWRDRLWMSATVRDRSPTGRCEMSLVELDASGTAIEATIDRDIEPERHQKNWMPFVEGDVLRFVYGLDPLRIVGFEPAEGRFRELTLGVPPESAEPPPRGNGWALDHLRGGSQGVPLPDGWLFLTHEAVVQDGWRCYLHRFVRLDRELRVTAVGEPFVFEQRGIEFAAGLLHDPASGHLLVTYGVDDRRAMLASLPIADLLRELPGAASERSEAPSALRLRRSPTAPAALAARAARASEPTFVSMFFDLQSAEGSARKDAQFYLSKSDFILSRDINLILFTEERYRDFFLQARATRRFLSKTSVITRKITELPYYPQLEEVQRHRERHPLLNGGPEKDTPLYTVLCWSKIGFVIEAIRTNPFSSRHFGWVDLAISHVARPGAESESFRNLYDEMSFLALREPRPADGLGDKGMSFYDYERALIAAAYFTGEKARWLDFAAAFERERSWAASQGYAPSEQQIFARVIYRDRKSYRLYRGDYASILSGYHATQGHSQR